MNPANLQWQYLLEDLKDEENSILGKSQYDKCIKSLEKFPLVVFAPKECRILEHFSKEIISKMERRIADMKRAEEECSRNSNDNLEVERMTQEENDFQIAVRLNEELNGASNNGDMGSLSPESAGHRLDDLYIDDIATTQRGSTDDFLHTSPTNIVTGTRIAASPPISCVSLSNDSDSDDPFSARPAKKPHRGKKKVRDEQLPKTRKTSAKSKPSQVKSAAHDISADEDQEEPGRPPVLQTLFGQDPVFNRSEVQKNRKKKKSDNASSQDDSCGKTRRNSSKEYVPKIESGGYAILIALLKEEQKPGGEKSMTISKLKAAAQQHTKTNMSFGQAGGSGPQCWYSGWSSAKILVEHELIKTWSCPKKVELTEKGRLLANRLLQEKENAESASMSASQSANGSSVNGSQSNNDTAFPDASWMNFSSALTSRSANDFNEIITNSTSRKFFFCYLDSDYNETFDQDRADVDIAGRVVSYLIKCNRKDLLESNKSYRIVTDSVEGAPDMCVAYLAEHDCEEIEVPVQTVTSGPPITQAPPIDMTHKKKSRPQKAAENRPPIIEEFHLSEFPCSWRIFEENVDTTLPDRDDSGVVLRAGRYEIVLVVDAMEVTGGFTGGNKNRKIITEQELKELNVNFECRKLSIGDFAWIAREKFSPNGTELVLPYIVERKRLDDLRASIMDNRYTEQKARLSISGIKKPFYLVEDSKLPSLAGGSNGKGLDAAALDQAVFSTWIKNGFQIKRTKNQFDSCQFLATFTKTLIEKYSGRDLKQDSIDGIAVAGDWETNLLSFNDFQQHSRPDKPTTVRKIFSNMLLCQSKLSAAMAWAITSKYPTPLALKMAYEGCDPELREKLLLGMPYDAGKKKIPLAVSKTVCAMFCDTNFM